MQTAAANDSSDVSLVSLQLASASEALGCAAAQSDAAVEPTVEALLLLLVPSFYTHAWKVCDDDARVRTGKETLLAVLRGRECLKSL